jgi:DNA-binding GntR family transcriptional regulator
MTDGETGDRSLWVTPPMETFRYDRPDLRFRVGLPAPVDLALYSFGDAAFFRGDDPGRLHGGDRAGGDRICELAETPDDVVFQIETGVGLISGAEGFPESQQQLGDQMAAGLNRLPGMAPGARHWGFHLCLGDFHHREAGPSSTRLTLVAPQPMLAGMPALDHERQLESVHERLRSAILRGDIPAGQLTTQTALAEHFNVGRTPLREALRMLQSEGLVVSERNRQVHIAGLSSDDAEQLYLMRIALETSAIRITVPTLTSQSFAELEGAMAQMDHYMKVGDQPGMRVPHLRFHRILVGGVGARVSRELSELSDHAERYRLGYGATTSWDRRRQEHREILDAAAAGDPDLAAEAIAAHYVRTAQLIFAAVDPARDLGRLRVLLTTVAPRAADLLLPAPSPVAATVR